MTSPPKYIVQQFDAFEWLQALPAGEADLVVTDPPYESLEKHRKVGTTTRLKQSAGSSNEWFEVIGNERLAELMALLHRALKQDTHCYVFCDQETLFALKPAGEAAGFKFWKPLILDKVIIGMGYHYRCRYECIAFFEKGKRKLNSLSVPDVLTAPRIRGGYPTEKPWELSRVIIGQSSHPGDVVIDPFMGSASVGHAALSCGRRFYGCDKKNLVQQAQDRLERVLRH
jgi:site-specific DNA-methyltransferase (adenine-specific)